MVLKRSLLRPASSNSAASAGRYTSSGELGGLGGLASVFTTAPPLAVTHSTGEVPAVGRGGERRAEFEFLAAAAASARLVRTQQRAAQLRQPHVDLCGSPAAIRHRQVREGGGAADERDEGWRAPEVPTQGRQADTLAHTHTSTH